MDDRRNGSAKRSTPYPQGTSAKPGDGVECAYRADAIAEWLLLFAALAARTAQSDVEQEGHGEQGNDSDQVTHDRAPLATVRDVLFLNRLFRQIEVEIEDKRDRQSGKNDNSSQHDDFLSDQLSRFGTGSFVEVQSQHLRDEDCREGQGNDSE